MLFRIFMEKIGSSLKTFDYLITIDLLNHLWRQNRLDDKPFLFVGLQVGRYYFKPK